MSRGYTNEYTLAGDESLKWHPLVSDFILIARKLEKLGFVYHRSSVVIIEAEAVVLG